METSRSWSLQAARMLLPEVRERTSAAVEEVEALAAARAEAKPDTPQWQELGERLEERLSRWVREMEALGLDVKGPWLVDFDTGAGYYCWRWPEESLDFFHSYEDGFDGRTRIQ